MAVGKGSMERASKAVTKTAAPVAKATEVAAAPAKKATVKKTAVKPAAKSAAKKTAAKVSAATTIPAPGPEVMEKILYQNSAEMLYRDAEPNERFEIGDSMPVYYF